MASDVEKGVTKTVDITIQATKVTSDVLKQALRDFLDNKTVKKGKISYRALSKRAGGKLESIEITDNNIKDFLDVAKRYDIDFALKRDKNSETPTYHVFFSTKQTDNFKKAFTEYAYRMQEKVDNKDRGEVPREQLKREAAKVAEQAAKQKKKERQRTKEEVL